MSKIETPSQSVASSVRQFSADDMLRFARYLTEGKSDDLLKHRFECWFRGPNFDRPGIEWVKPIAKLTETTMISKQEPRSGSVDQLGGLEAALAQLKFAAVMYDSSSKWARKMQSEECRRLMEAEEARCGGKLRRAAKAFAEAASSTIVMNHPAE